MKERSLLPKIQCSPTGYLAFGIFSLGITLSLWASPFVAQAFMLAMLITGSIGVGYLMLGPLARHKLSTVAQVQVKAPGFRSLVLLFIVQGLFLFLTWIFFYTFETQTHLTGRLQALEAGHLMGLLKANPWTLGVAPWMLFAVFGVGLCYLSLRFQQAPTLPTVLFKDHQKHPQAFLYYYCQVAVDTVSYMPFVLLLSLLMIWSVEALNFTFDWPSLFKYPIRSFLSFMLIIFLFRKTHLKFLEWATERRQPLAVILGFYAFGLAGMMFWMHSIGSHFTFGTEITDPNVVMKSPLAGSFSKQALENRLELLIWGWWGLWMPSFAALIARLSMGLKIYQACFNALLLPLVLFLGILPQYHSEFFQALFSQELSLGMHWWAVAFLFFVCLMLFGKVQTTAELHRGAMPSLDLPLRSRLLKKWVISALYIFVCSMLAVFVLGWVPLQVIGTFGTGFMLSVFLIFLFVLFSSKAPHVAEAKCKAPCEL